MHFGCLFRLSAWVALASCAVGVSAAGAQPLGAFRWQLHPFCNVITLDVVQRGAIFTLDGVDDQCGLTNAASIVGTASTNPGGSVGLGFTLVESPGAVPVHVAAVISVATISGTWADSAGRAGTFVFSPPAPASGAPRPIGGGLAGSAVTAVAPGAGLVGGGSTGVVNLAVAFGGTGAASTAARSDHTHATAGFGTAVGAGALAVDAGLSNTAVGTQALTSSATGTSNTAVGRNSLFSNQTGSSNTALGVAALNDNVAGSQNTAIGQSSLVNSTTGNENTAVGFASLFRATTANNNTAIGTLSLQDVTTGSHNIAIGRNAGANITTGMFNIHIGVTGHAGDSNTIRIGANGQTRTFLAAVRGTTTDFNDAVGVVIDSRGQLGTLSSTRRTKTDIVDLGAPGHAIQRLRPVRFRYRVAFADGETPVQYGLIAEEVADVLPELVARDASGEPAAVKYHVLPVLLLAEVQRLERERAAQDLAIREQRLEFERRLGEIERLLSLRRDP